MSQPEEQQWKLLLLEALVKERREEAQQVIEEVYPYDLANWYGELGKTEQERLLRYLDHERLADVIEELEIDEHGELLDGWPGDFFDERLVEVLPGLA